MRHAVDEIAAESGKNPKQAKAEAVTFYESVVANPDSSEHAKLRAQENLDWIFGNRAPTVTKVGNETDAPFKTEQQIVKMPFKGCTDDELERILQSLPANRTAAVNGTNGNGHP
jgi:hypothetical protein